MAFSFAKKLAASLRGGPALPPGPSPVPDPDELEEGGAGKMSFLDHLDELRKRLVASAIALFVGFLIALVFITRIFEFIMRPLQQMLPAGSKLIYTEPTEAFMLQLKLAALAGIMIAAPIITWQIWLFVAPGLYVHEKRLAIPFIAMSTVFFVAGAAFSHYVVFPWAWVFLASFTTDYMMFAPKIDAVFSPVSYTHLTLPTIYSV